MQLAVLASGSGTILNALADADVAIDLVVVDRPCGATDVATNHGIDWLMVERESFRADFDRDSYTNKLTDVLVDRGIDLVAMAGFGTILTEHIHDRYEGRILNTHPSLLPSFPGWTAVEDAMAAGVKVTGCTVHIATVEVDAGPILAQTAVTVEPDDTVESLHERIKEVERQMYPETLLAILQRGSVT